MKVKNKSHLSGQHFGKPRVVFQDSQQSPGQLKFHLAVACWATTGDRTK